jgi:hypothetical protein
MCRHEEQRNRNYTPSTCIGVFAGQEVRGIPLGSAVYVEGSSDSV